MTTLKSFLALSALIAITGVSTCAQQITVDFHWKDCYILPILVPIQKISQYTTLDEVQSAVEKTTGIPRDEQELSLTVQFPPDDKTDRIVMKHDDKKYYRKSQIDGWMPSAISRQHGFRLVTSSLAPISHRLIWKQSSRNLYFSLGNNVKFESRPSPYNNTLLATFQHTPNFPREYRGLQPQFSCSGCGRTIPPDTSVDECACCVINPFTFDTSNHISRHTKATPLEGEVKEKSQICMQLSRTINVTFPETVQTLQNRRNVLTQLTTLQSTLGTAQQFIEASAPPAGEPDHDQPGSTQNNKQTCRTHLETPLHRLNQEIQKTQQLLHDLPPLKCFTQSRDINHYTSYLSTAAHIATLLFFGYKAYQNYRAFNIASLTRNGRALLLQNRMRNNVIGGLLLGAIPLGAQVSSFIRERSCGNS